MENLALIESFSDFKGDKNIDRVTLMAILEEVFRAALKRKFGSDDNFDIIINPDKGDLEIWRNRVVVADGMSEDDNEEIELSEARKIEPDFEIGEDVSEEVKNKLRLEHSKLNPATMKKEIDRLTKRVHDVQRRYGDPRKLSKSA